MEYPKTPNDKCLCICVDPRICRDREVPSKNNEPTIIIIIIIIIIMIIIIIIITYIYNALNDALSASRIHNKLKTILSKYIHIQNRQS